MGNHPSKDPASELISLMSRTEQTELQCRKYLVNAQERLVKATPIRFLPQEEEYRGHFGDSDYMVRCVDLDDVGRERNLAYLWEVKAPQCPLFIKDTRDRAKPSRDLISAENQLLHYYHELNNNPGILKDFKILQGDFRFGGIIIGSIKNFVAGKFKYPEAGMRSAFHAFELRKKYFYERSSIELITWDRIVEHMQRNPPVSLAKSKETIPEGLKDNPPDLNIHVIGSINVGESVLAVLKQEAK